MKKLILISIISLGIMGLYFLLKPSSNVNKDVLEYKINNDNKLISIMLEKEAGTSNYEKSNDGFPTEGYIFNKELSKCVNGSEITYENNEVVVKATGTDKCYAYFDVDALGSICRGENMAECFIKNYQKDGAIIYHDGNPDYEGEENYELEAGDLSYRYTGGNDIVHNYVCFGSTASLCPENNLYQIIGFFKNDMGEYEAKLVKANYATSNELGSVGLVRNTNDNFEWNNVLDTNWANSQLNKENLNNYYINEYLTNDWSNMITKSNWQMTKVKFSDGIKNNAKNVYEFELGKNKPDIESINAKIGLMYISDYMYMANPKYWTYPGYTSEVYLDPNGNYGPEYDYRKAKSSNNIWLTFSQTLYLITFNYQATNNTVFTVSWNGSIETAPIDGRQIYPCFYLEKTVKVISGNGTKENPFRIGL